MAAATSTMTSQYETALDRAHSAHLRIIGRGTDKATGTAFVAVSSSRGGVRVHVVGILPSTLVCDCEAARYGKYCSHRAVAHEHLVAERAASH